MNQIQLPIVLSIAGHDPVGGAGIQADIEAITAQGCRAASAITSLTVQDSRDVQALNPVDPELTLAQARAVLADLPVAVIKLGLIGSSAMAVALARLLAEWPHIPVVLDPVLAAGGGTSLSDNGVIDSVRQRLLPHTHLLTPNLAEARALSVEAEPDACARALLAAGTEAVLLTGADAREDDARVINRLYETGKPVRLFEWPRLPHGYHGSGCTLAAACAARLALGEDLETAVERAQRYTWNSLQKAERPGHGQHLPTRWPTCS